MRSRWLFAAFVFCAALAALQLWAVEHFLYWIYPWFDVPMHFLGGVSIATFLVALLLHRRPRIFSVLFALALIAWEVFEYVFGIPREANYLFDTALDFLMGALGGILIYVIARMTLWR